MSKEINAEIMGSVSRVLRAHQNALEQLVIGIKEERPEKRLSHAQNAKARLDDVAHAVGILQNIFG